MAGTGQGRAKDQTGLSACRTAPASPASTLHLCATLWLFHLLPEQDGSLGQAAWRPGSVAAARLCALALHTRQGVHSALAACSLSLHVPALCRRVFAHAWPAALPALCGSTSPLAKLQKRIAAERKSLGMETCQRTVRVLFKPTRAQAAVLECRKRT